MESESDVAEYPYPKHRARAEKAVSSTDFDASVEQVFDEAMTLLLRKHRDYGPKNISQSPGGPLNGLRVRMWDKTARLNNLLDSGDKPYYESLKDTLVDLMNYAAIGILVLEKKWPNE